MTTYTYKVKAQYDELMQEYNRIAVPYMLGNKSLEKEYNDIIAKIEAVEDVMYSKIELPEDYEPEYAEGEEEELAKADYQLDMMREE